MTRKAVVISISRNAIWKETAKYLKHFRVKFIHDIDSYNEAAAKIISLYRDTDTKIANDEIRITKFQFRDLINELELEKGK